ncbi:MAG: hypothetical protein GXO87_04385 [Chlorobi bacterium]|nr:hypothetical protein [Chlorobiota bacterium]
MFVFSNPLWFAGSSSIRVAWDGIYFFVLLISFGSIWSNRLREKRILFFAALPVSVKEIAVARFWFAVFPFTIMTSFIILFQTALGIDVPSGFGALALQVGLAFVVIAVYIKVRDEWFSHKGLPKKIIFVSVTALISLAVVVLLISVLIYYEREIGNALRFFSKLIFYFVGLIIMAASVPSYKKRNEYLN